RCERIPVLKLKLFHLLKHEPTQVGADNARLRAPASVGIVNVPEKNLRAVLQREKLRLFVVRANPGRRAHVEESGDRELCEITAVITADDAEVHRKNLRQHESFEEADPRLTRSKSTGDSGEALGSKQEGPLRPSEVAHALF